MKPINELLSALPESILSKISHEGWKQDTSLEPNPISAIWGVDFMSDELFSELEKILPFPSNMDDHVFISPTNSNIPAKYIWEYKPAKL
jgi:hypothetical protein